MNGIYILANDVVYDQLIALLNSIERNAGKNLPVCIIPYDDRLDKVRDAISKRNRVEILEDKSAIVPWENFSTQVWQSNSIANKTWRRDGEFQVYRMGMHRRFCVLDGPFDRFIYLDADILIMNSLEFIFEQLDHHDWVVYDFQHKDPSHVYDVTSSKLYKIFSKSRIASEIFCAGLYASKTGVFNSEKKEWLLSKLGEGEADILCMSAPDQAVLNYMVMRSGVSNYNFAHHLSEGEKTGCCVTSPHFQEHNGVLYDEDKRLTYLHYIGIPSKLFRKVCAGENVHFPYRDLFLYYRYLHEPDQRPILEGEFKRLSNQTPPNLKQKILRKLGLTL